MFYQFFKITVFFLNRKKKLKKKHTDSKKSTNSLQTKKSKIPYFCIQQFFYQFINYFSRLLWKTSVFNLFNEEIRKNFEFDVESCYKNISKIRRFL